MKNMYGRILKSQKQHLFGRGKFNISILIFISMILCSSCKSGLPHEAWLNSTKTQEETVKEHVEKLAKALVKKDAKTIVSYLSEDAKKNVKSRDDKINELLDFCKGKMVKIEADTSGSSEDSENDSLIIGAYATITTTKNKYKLVISECVSNDIKEKIGVISIKIIEESKFLSSQEWTKYFKRPDIRCYYE